MNYIVGRMFGLVEIVLAEIIQGSFCPGHVDLACGES